MRITQQERSKMLAALGREFDGMVAQIERAVEKLDTLGPESADRQHLLGKIRQWHRGLGRIADQIVAYGGKKRTAPEGISEAVEAAALSSGAQAGPPTPTPKKS